VVTTPWKAELRALVELLELQDRPTALVCSNDMTAIGVIREAYDHGIKIPTDMSVVGFDDIRLARSMIPPLTTVQMSQNELAQIAFRALLKEVGRESPSTQKSEYELNTNLILRRSTAMALPSSSRPRLTRHLRLPASPAKSIGT
jgi:DNA-binding LacI/PurR family transcriptional regulator